MRVCVVPLALSVGILSTNLLAQQPLVPQARSTPPDESRAVTSWTVTTDGQTLATAVGIRKGPTLRLQAGTQTLRARSNVAVSARFSVAATFQSVGSIVSTYGLSLGTLGGGTQFLLRSDGQWAVATGGSELTAAVWTRVVATGF